ncbi:MAG: hypothetical protein Q8Q18_02255 [bacterium]|nr:hypothetical protein [bacterium]
MSIDLTTYKETLEAEKIELEARLSKLARRNPSNPHDFETTYNDEGGERQLSKPDVADRAEDIEEYETRNAIEVQLEEHYNDIEKALARIENHTFGWCEVEGESHEIEATRLELYPVARTCVAHKDIEL